LVSTPAPFSLSIAVSAFQRASDHGIVFSAAALKQNEETKAINAKKFIKAKKQGQAEMASRALKPDLAELD
jgi:hypothetical protein